MKSFEQQSEVKPSLLNVGSTNKFRVKAHTIVPQDAVVEIQAQIRVTAPEVVKKTQKNAEETYLIDVTVLLIRGPKEELVIWTLFQKPVVAEKKSRTSEMLNLIAHEMRSPLIAIEGLIKLFMTKSSMVVSSNSQMAELVDGYLVKATIFLRNLLDACQLILELSRTQPGKEVVKTTEFEVRKLLGETVRLFEKIVEGNKDKPIKLLYSCEDQIDTFIKSDPVRIR